LLLIYYDSSLEQGWVGTVFGEFTRLVKCSGTNIGFSKNQDAFRMDG